MIRDVISWIGLSDFATFALLMFFIAFLLVLITLALTQSNDALKYAQLPLEDDRLYDGAKENDK